MSDNNIDKTLDLITEEQKDALLFKYSGAINRSCADTIVPKLNGLSKKNYCSAMSVKIREPLTATLLAINLGVFGIDRFYVKDYALGACKLALFVLQVILITVGYYCLNSGCIAVGYIVTAALSIWVFVDVFYIGYRAREVNYENLCHALLTRQN